jgi:hypothetical protein
LAVGLLHVQLLAEASVPSLCHEQPRTVSDFSATSSVTRLSKIVSRQPVAPHPHGSPSAD